MDKQLIQLCIETTYKGTRDRSGLHRQVLVPSETPKWRHTPYVSSALYRMLDSPSPHGDSLGLLRFLVLVSVATHFHLSDQLIFP